MLVINIKSGSFLTAIDVSSVKPDNVTKNILTYLYKLVLYDQLIIKL